MGSPAITVVPVSKTAAVVPTGVTTNGKMPRNSVVTVILSKDACQEPYSGKARVRHTHYTHVKIRQTALDRGTQVMGALNRLEFTPPRKSSEPEEASLMPNTGDANLPSEIRV